MMPISVTDLAICLYLAVCLIASGTVFSGNKADRGSTATDGSKPIFSGSAMSTFRDAESFCQRTGQCQEALSAQECHEMFIGEQPAQGVDHEQQSALAHGRSLDEQLLSICLF